MTDNSILCEYCGAQLARDANFCEKCGKPARKQPVAQPYSAQVPPPSSTPPQAPSASRYAPPAYTAAPVQPAKQKLTLWIILGAGGCLTFLCIALIAVGVIFFMRSRPDGQEASILPSPEPVQSRLSTEIPAPEQPTQAIEAPDPTQAPADVPTLALPLAETQAPAPVDPTQPAETIITWPGNIGQELSGAYFKDDFSTDKYGWSKEQDEVSAFAFEEGHYALHVLMANYSSWAYLPTDFNPSSIGFDAAVVQGYEQGAYGVMCHYQDEQNYYFVSIDPLNKEYSIGYVLNDEYFSLMNDMWMPAYFLNDSPYAVNNILIACDSDMITLFVNNELEAQASTETQLGGEVAIFGETWEDTPESGFKVLFDNLNAYIPVQ